MVITLDGPSATGKSTLAKLLAKKLDYKFLNSGMIYRCLSYYFLSNNILPSSENQINTLLEDVHIDIQFCDGEQNIVINGKNLTKYATIKQVQDSVSLYSQLPMIRKKVLYAQRAFAMRHNIVIEGRDTGTEVFPRAEFKFYVVCDIMVRAKRRHSDLVNAGQDISLEEVKKSLEKRDYLDSTRKYSPLVKPDNAIIVDTTNSTIEKSLGFLLNYVKRR